MRTLIFTTLMIMSSVYAQILLRVRLTKAPIKVSFFSIDYVLHILADVWILSSGFAFGLSFIFWSMVINEGGNLSKIYPATTALIVLLVTLGNLFFFRDRLSFLNFIGGALILFGLFLLLRPH